MSVIKKGEAYIETVITIFLSMMILVLALNMINYYNAYHKLDYIAQEMLRSAEMNGETTSVQLGQRYESLKTDTGLGSREDGTLGYGKTKDLKISFEGSEFIESPHNTTGAVQRLDTIKVTVQCTAVMPLLGKAGELNIPMSVTKTGLSENYWNTTGASGNGVINGTSSDWLVSGKTLVAYIGPVTAGMSLVIPNHVDGLPVNALGWDGGDNILGATDDTNIVSITISEGIEYINPYAFLGFMGLQGQLQFPSTLKYIGDGAFKNCINLSGDLTIPSGVTGIYSEAFVNTGFKGRLNLPNTVTYIGASAFRGVMFTGTLDLPSELSVIESNVFTGCNQFTGTLIIPNKVKTIKMQAFQACAGLTGLSLGNSVQIVDTEAFYQCYNLRGTLIIPNTVTKIGDGAFCFTYTNEYRNDTLVMGTAVQTIGHNAFYGDDGFNCPLVLPNTLTSIGRYAFFDCQRLNGTLTLPSSLTLVDEGGFDNCKGFTSLKFNYAYPRAMTLKNIVFLNCTGLTGTVTLYNVQSIGSNVFTNCSNLQEITYYTGTTVDANAFYNCPAYITVW